MTTYTHDFFAIFEILSKYKVDFIVVGGVCAVLHGAPVTTFDLDVVHSRDPENIARLIPALQELNAYYRGGQDQQLKPGGSHLSSPGHQLLMSRFGPLDLLGTVGDGHSFEELWKDSSELDVGGLGLRVLSLEKLIEIKEETGFEKDKAILPILRRTLAEKRRG